jgi:hypothetical protein
MGVLVDGLVPKLDYMFFVAKFKELGAGQVLTRDHRRTDNSDEGLLQIQTLVFGSGTP